MGNKTKAFLMFDVVIFCAAILASALFGQTPHASYRVHVDPNIPAGVSLPDPVVTPGVVRTTDAKAICAATFRTAPFRKTTQATKDAVYKEYAVQRNKGVCAGGCEVDHLLPLELGGLDDIKNLWPQPSQPIPAFHQKDLLENWLKKQVCSGKMSLADAQQAIMKDWYAEYLTMMQTQ